MLEILLPAIVFLVLVTGLMAKKKRRTYLRVLPFQKGITVDNLADSTCQKGDLTQTVDEDSFAISVDVICSFDSGAAPQGPVTVGVAHGDYEASEIEEWLEATTSWNFADKIANEQRKRKCRRIGEFSGVSANETLNDGKPIRVPLRFMLQEGETLSFWAYNRSGAALNASTDIAVSGTLYAKKA